MTMIWRLWRFDYQPLGGGGGGIETKEGCRISAIAKPFDPDNLA